MFKETWKTSAGILVLTGSLLLGGCASQDSVTRAQSTADQALQAAQAASQKADAATAAANAAAAAAKAASTKADRMYQQGLKK